MNSVVAASPDRKNPADALERRFREHNARMAILALIRRTEASVKGGAR